MASHLFSQFRGLAAFFCKRTSFMYSAGLNFPNRLRILMQSRGNTKESKWKENNKW